MGSGGGKEVPHAMPDAQSPEAPSASDSPPPPTQHPRPNVTCTSVGGLASTRAILRTRPPGLDLSHSVNEQNVFIASHQRPNFQEDDRPRLYRVPNSHTMEPGQKKLLACGGHTVVVLRTEEGWAALDNACYHHGGPLYLGDIEEYNGQTCLVCPWHRSKIAISTGISLYEAFDASTCDHHATDKSGGPRQRVHEIVERDGEVLIRLNRAEQGSYASDRYAALDIASNDQQRLGYEMAEAENSSKECMKRQIQMRRSSMKAEKERRKREKEAKEKRRNQPMRVPAGQLTPRGDASAGPYVPSWVARGELPPPIEENYDDDDWSPALDLAEEYRDLEEQYAVKREAADRQQQEGFCAKSSEQE
eukprot:Sspe_Gene.99369::Locus_72900_Transcript_1_1_Confidence_1.000_Length_1329::g.99369::m.99369